MTIATSAFAPFDGSWLLRPRVLDPVRKPIAVTMLSIAAVAGAAALADDVLDSRAPMSMAGAAVPDHHPITLSPTAPPYGGTAIHPGYHAAPPYGPVDPHRAVQPAIVTRHPLP
jgi:hypothetical protein